MPLERKKRLDRLNERYCPYSVNEPKGRLEVAVDHNLPREA